VTARNTFPVTKSVHFDVKCIKTRLAGYSTPVTCWLQLSESSSYSRRCERTNWFSIQKGVRQGCSTSPGVNRRMDNP